MISSRVIAEGLFSYQIGGSERVGADLALEFSRRGYEVVCFAFYDSDGPIRAELERAGIRCLDMNYERFDGWSKRVAYQWDLLRMLRREAVGALHVHHATALILCGLPAKLSKVARLVMTEHGLHQLKERPNYRRSAARYCRFADVITGVEPAQVDYFHDSLGVPREKLCYVPNGVRMNRRTPERASAIRSALGIAPQTFAFFYVGRLSVVKDLGTMLRALALLPPDVVQSTILCMVGDGPERASLESLAERLRLGARLRFLGARSDVADLLMAGDAFVMSSKTEGLPMALLEAMAAGLPCVATAVGGIPGLLASGKGMLVPPADPEKLAEAMASVVRRRDIAARMAAEAQADVGEHFSLESVASRYLELLGLEPKMRPST